MHLIQAKFLSKLWGDPRKGGKLKKMVDENGINSIQALKLVLEDPSTVSFIKAYFSSPEDRPTIITRKYLSRSQTGVKWRVEIIEKSSFFSAKKELINLALIDVDSTQGKIIKRRFFRSLLWPEYQRIKELPS